MHNKTVWARPFSRCYPYFSDVLKNEVMAMFHNFYGGVYFRCIASTLER